MNKFIAALAVSVAILPAELPAEAQTYPSPTFAAVTLQNCPTGKTVVGGGAGPLTCVNSFASVPNASGSNQNTTTGSPTGCVAGNTAVTLVAPIDFANGQGISLEHCGAAFSGSAPTGLTVVPATGIASTPTNTTAYSYQIACANTNGSVGAAITAVNITNGDATLGRVVQSARYVAYNTISWSTTCPGVAIWRNKASGGYHLIGVYRGSSGTMPDAGQAAVTIPWVPDTPTASALAARLVTTISSGQGTTSLVIAAAPITAATGSLVRHDDTAALVAYLASTPYAELPAGTFNIEGLSPPSTSGGLVGSGSAATSLIDWQVGTTSVILSGVPKGYQLLNMTITPLAGGSMQAVEALSINNCNISNNALSGSTTVFTSGTQGCTYFNNKFSNWYVSAINDTSGNSDIIANNLLNAGLSSPVGIGILVNLSQLVNVHDNIVQGGEVFAIDLLDSNNSIIQNNLSLNSTHESFHLGHNSNQNVIQGNTANENSFSIDYCISVSDDGSGTASTLASNRISDNHLELCGISAIAISQFGGVSVSFANNIVTGNTILNSNRDTQASTPDIVLNGANVSQTFVNNNTCISASAVDYQIEENSTFGTPTGTQVGTMFGLAGASGKVHLIGSGSAALTAATTTNSTGL